MLFLYFLAMFASAVADVAAPVRPHVRNLRKNPPKNSKTQLMEDAPEDSDGVEDVPFSGSYDEWKKGFTKDNKQGVIPADTKAIWEEAFSSHGQTNTENTVPEKTFEIFEKGCSPFDEAVCNNDTYKNLCVWNETDQNCTAKAVDEAKKKKFQCKYQCLDGPVDGI